MPLLPNLPPQGGKELDPSTLEDFSLNSKAESVEQLRTITLIDVPALFQIESQVHAHPWTEGMFYDCFKLESAELGYTGYILEKVENSSAQSIPVAYLVTQTILDECHILTLGVKKKYQHQGYASQLIQHLFDTYSYQRFLLEVRESNQAAIHLYQKLGFQCIAKRKNYYLMSNNCPENALIFERKILNRF